MSSRVRRVSRRSRIHPPDPQEGQSLVEYGLLLSFVALVGLLAARVLGGLLTDFFRQIATLLETFDLP